MHPILLSLSTRFGSTRSWETTPLLLRALSREVVEKNSLTTTPASERNAERVREETKAGCVEGRAGQTSVTYINASIL